MAQFWVQRASFNSGSDSNPHPQSLSRDLSYRKNLGFTSIKYPTKSKSFSKQWFSNFSENRPESLARLVEIDFWIPQRF